MPERLVLRNAHVAGNKVPTRVTDSYCRVQYWFDLGNNAASGQYLLGQPSNAQNKRSALRLRTISELYPEIIDAAAGEDSLPSCSAAEALERQEPYINQVLASSALAMLARLLHYGRLTHHGAFFNAATGSYVSASSRSEVMEKDTESLVGFPAKGCVSSDRQRIATNSVYRGGDGARDAESPRFFISPRSKSSQRPRLPERTYRRPPCRAGMSDV